MKLSTLILNLGIFFQISLEISAKYEIIMESVETLLGDEDETVENIDARVRKYNRTM